MSLQHLFLRDFVIVDELDLAWQSGFTALTGETGAGKSILIDALQLVLGARADSGVVREGAARADISASFVIDAGVHHWLQAQGFDSDDSEDLLLRRTIDAQGKSRAWINGQPATATQLRALGDQLLDIHGQHAWQSLTRPDAVRGLLDAYAGVRLDALQTAWAQWRQAMATLNPSAWTNTTVNAANVARAIATGVTAVNALAIVRQSVLGLRQTWHQTLTLPAPLPWRQAPPRQLLHVRPCHVWRRSPCQCLSWKRLHTAAVWSGSIQTRNALPPCKRPSLPNPNRCTSRVSALHLW